MKNSNIYLLEEITFEESKIISGGGVKEWGAKAKEIWCDIKDAWKDFKASPSAGYGGVTGIGTYGATK
jgi:hypothetical protein